MQNVTLLGATGSIGQSTLDVISLHKENFTLFAVTANTSVKRLLDICLEYHPRFAVMLDVNCAKDLKHQLDQQQFNKVEVLSGEQALIDVASDSEVDSVMAAIVGSVGLMPTLAAVRAGKRVLLANKESLVMAGALFMQEVETYQAELLPIDSEHNAIFQCLPSGRKDKSLLQKGIEKILLTGSGGPFRKTPLDQFESITPDQAISHPNWDMGPKISVDSATMMNKGLELIEACWLFDVDQSVVEFVVHPQSIIHSMVAYNDGSVLAQMGNPDMRTPIANALAWPDRIDSGVEPLDFFQVNQLEFEPADHQRFPCLNLARESMISGGTRMAMLNAANEVAVDSFLKNRIRFTEIPILIDGAMQKLESHVAESLDTILLDDQRARQFVSEQIQ